MLKTVALIPARYGSTRFPGKMLASLCGKPLIVRTCEAVARVGDVFDSFYVVTDDSRIYNAVVENGFNAIMSQREHSTGSDRIAEAIENIDCDIVVNVQGDEPFTSRQPLELLLSPYYGADAEKIDLTTLKQELTDKTEIENPNNVKVITDCNDFALYFSRSVIPYPRKAAIGIRYFKHIGIYAFRRQTLLDFTHLPQLQNEAAESIECIRFLEYGKRIKVLETANMGVSIDTLEDMANAEKIYSI